MLISSPPPARTWPRAFSALAYVLMIAAAVGLFFLIRMWGERLAPPGGADPLPASASPDASAPYVMLHLLLVLAAVIALGRALAAVFRYVGQPPVIGEVVAGILLGPSLLGRLWPEAGAFLLPASVEPVLSAVAQLGVVLYMFVVGLELNAVMLQKRGHAALAISHASIVIPFVLGAVLALGLYPDMAGSNVGFTVFALFLGVAMSVTAFPVLARILSDRGLSKTALGSMALACAAADDVTAWCLLALVVGVAKSQISSAAITSLLTVAYIALMYAVLRPFVARLTHHYEGRPFTPSTMAFFMVGLLASSLVTEAIGVHAIFGAFLFGAVIPHDSRAAHELRVRIEDLVGVLLLPAFFALTGMRTQIGLVSDAHEWLICGLIIVVATAGKFGGTLLAARITRTPWRESAALGVLMNTRGLMGLIVLNIGLDLGVISPTLFAMMVIMALVTTMATSPALVLLLGRNETGPGAMPTPRGHA